MYCVFVIGLASPTMGSINQEYLFYTGDRSLPKRLLRRVSEIVRCDSISLPSRAIGRVRTTRVAKQKYDRSLVSFFRLGISRIASGSTDEMTNANGFPCRVRTRLDMMRRPCAMWRLPLKQTRKQSYTRHSLHLHLHFHFMFNHNLPQRFYVEKYRIASLPRHNIPHPPT